MPDTTVAYLAVPGVPELCQQFMNTSLGRMSQDPQMKPLIDQLYASVADAVTEFQDRIGLSLPELLAIPQGEVAVAMVAPKDVPMSAVVFIEAGNQLPNARKLLERGMALVEQTGATKSEENVGGTKLTIYDNLPQLRKAAFFERDATLVLGADVEVLKQILAAWDGQKGGRLSDTDRYNAIMNRCRGPNDEIPHIVAFVDPVGIMKSMSSRDAGARLSMALLPALGIDGISAVGAAITFDVGQFDTLTHAHLLLENPRSGVVKMVALQSGDIKPERWVPADVADYITLHWNYETTYRALASIYDSFRGDGALANDLQVRFLGEAGLDVDKDVLPALEGRATVFTWYERPITFRSQSRVLGVKLKNVDLAKKTLDKVVEKYQDRIVRQTYAQKPYFQLQAPPPPQDRPAPPPGEDRPDRPQPPQPCFGILGDYLIVADRQTAFEKAVLTSVEGTKSLGDELDFKLVLGKIQRQAERIKPSMIGFTRPEEQMRFLYEMAAAGIARRAQRPNDQRNRFQRSVDAAFSQNPLPPFEVLERYLAPGGSTVVDDDSGIHYMSFSMRRKSN